MQHIIEGLKNMLTILAISFINRILLKKSNSSSRETDRVEYV